MIRGRAARRGDLARRPSAPHRKRPHRVRDHSTRAPPRVPPAEPARQPACDAPLRQCVVDEDAQPAERGIRGDLEPHAIRADHEESHIAGGLPRLAMGRLALGHDLVDEQVEAEDAPTEADPGSDGAPRQLIGLDPHPGAGHHPRRLAHVGGEPVVLVEMREQRRRRRGDGGSALVVKPSHFTLRVNERNPPASLAPVQPVARQSPWRRAPAPSTARTRRG